MTTMSTTHCAIENCRTTILNKPPGVSFHPCPSNNEMRKRWLRLLKNKCSVLDWYKSQICSKHFEPKFFDSQRKLKEYAIPTIFAPGLPKLTPKPTTSKPQNKNPKADLTQSPPTKQMKTQKQSQHWSGFVSRVPWNYVPEAHNNQEHTRSKVERMLNKLTQAELTHDIKTSFNRLREPSDLDSYVTDDLRCRQDAPKEAHLWLMIKKQENLNNRLIELVVQTKKHVEILQNHSEEAKTVKKDNECTIESLKYVIKCLQEKHATLEEQIEILTAVESR